MARVKIESIVNHLSTEFQRALAETIQEEIADAQFDDRELFRAFVKKVYRKCRVWENVPDVYVEVDKN